MADNHIGLETDMQTKVENEIAESEKGGILGRNASAAVFDRR